MTSEKDREKVNACENEGITLISVPHWWDGSATRLEQTMLGQQPALMANLRVVKR